MNYEQIETAIIAHMEAYRRLMRAILQKSCEAGECSDREFELRQALIDGRGDGTQTEIRRVTYIAGFLIVSQTREREQMVTKMADVGGERMS